MPTVLLTRRSIDLGMEAAAVVLSLLYTLLYLRGAIPGCYYAAFGGALLFMFLCYRKKIYAESFLQLFYLGMAVYGYLNTDEYWEVTHWTFSEHIPYLAGSSLLTVLVGLYLKRKTDAKRPFIDAFTTVFSIGATWLMVNYVHENWLYWIVIDAVSIFLYASRKMYLGALLFVLYLLMAIDGFVESINWFGG